MLVCKASPSLDNYRSGHGIASLSFSSYCIGGQRTSKCKNCSLRNSGKCEFCSGNNLVITKCLGCPDCKSPTLQKPQRKQKSEQEHEDRESKREQPRREEQKADQQKKQEPKVDDEYGDMVNYRW